MLQSDLKDTVNSVWNSAVTSFSSKQDNRLILHGDRIVVPGTFCYAVKVLPEPLAFEEIVEVPANKFIQLLGAAPAGELSIQIDGGKLTLRSGRFRGVIPIKVLTSLPEPPEVSEQHATRIGVDDMLWGMLNNAAEFADNAGSNQFELTCLSIGPQGLFACNRISLIHYNNFNQDFNKTFLIPKNVMMCAGKMGGTPSQITAYDRYIGIDWENGFVLCPSTDVDYPVEHIFDILQKARGGGSVWECERGDIEDAVNRVALLSDRVSLYFMERRLVVKSLGDIQTSDIVMGKTTGGLEGRLDLIMPISEIKLLLSVCSSNTIKWVFDGGKLEEGENGVLLWSGEGGFECCSMMTVQQ